MIRSLLLIIDAGDLTARCYHASWSTANCQPHKDDYRCTYSCIQSLTSSMQEWRPSSIVLACDADNGDYNRKVFWNEYKASRKNDEVFQHHRRFAIGVIARTLPIHIVKKHGFEADDLIAQIAARSLSKRVVIVANDHDLLQIKQAFPDRVTIYSQTKKCELLLQDPEIDFRKFKALVGDKSDNIPPVTGKVTASNLLHTGGKLEEWLDDGVTRCEKISRREAYERNLKLVSLLGSECIVPKIAVPDVESKVKKHNLLFLRQLCMDIMRPKLFSQSYMDKIESSWRAWYAKRISEGHGIVDKKGCQI